MIDRNRIGHAAVAQLIAWRYNFLCAHQLPAAMERDVDAYRSLYLAALGRSASAATVKVIGAMGFAKEPFPLEAAFLQLDALVLGTTLGASMQGSVHAADDSFDRFELCAMPAEHSPRILVILAALAKTMLAELSQPARPAYRPYDVLRLEGNPSRFTRFMLVPRFRLDIAGAAPIDVIEPIPVTEEVWSELASTPRDHCTAWVRANAREIAAHWTEIIRGTVTASPPG